MHACSPPRRGALTVGAKGEELGVASYSINKAYPMMTHKYSVSIVILSINKSVEPNEEQKVLTSDFKQVFTLNTSSHVFRCF